MEIRKCKNCGHVAFVCKAYNNHSFEGVEQQIFEATSVYFVGNKQKNTE